jgi:hypothetical protein
MSATVNGLTNTRLIGPAVVAVAMGALAVANFVTEGDNGGAAPFAVATGIAAVLALVLFGRTIPRTIESGQPARVGLVLGAIGVLSLAVFWSGVPYVLGPAAIVLGLAAPRSSEATAAVAIGAVTYVAALVGAFVA